MNLLIFLLILLLPFGAVAEISGVKLFGHWYSVKTTDIKNNLSFCTVSTAFQSEGILSQKQYLNVKVAESERKFEKTYKPVDISLTGNYETNKNDWAIKVNDNFFLVNNGKTEALDVLVGLFRTEKNATITWTTNKGKTQKSVSLNGFAEAYEYSTGICNSTEMPKTNQLGVSPYLLSLSALRTI